MTSETFGLNAFTPTLTSGEGGSWPPVPPLGGESTTFAASNMVGVTKLIIEHIVVKPVASIPLVATLTVYKDDDVTQTQLITLTSVHTTAPARTIMYGLEVDGPISATHSDGNSVFEVEYTIFYRVIARD